MILTQIIIGRIKPPVVDIGALNIRMQLPERVTCFYFRENAECLKERCPYHPAKAKPEK